MAKKIEITDKQVAQFNSMLAALKQIHKDYQTPSQLKKSCDSDYGLGYEETLEMAYENIQGTARFASKNIKPISSQVKQ